MTHPGWLVSDELSVEPNSFEKRAVRYEGALTESQLTTA